jgi:hypothetical protein
MQTKDLDLVYILGDFSKNNDFEFRYSLRSASKYLKFRNVHVIGHLPEWTTNVYYTGYDDPYVNKQSNAVHKILRACKIPHLSENFVLMNDDFFFLSPVTKIPYYSLGNIGALAKKYTTGRYLKAVLNTIELIGTRSKNFEVHYPMIFNKNKLYSLFVGKDRVVNWRKYPVVYRSIYGAKYKVSTITVDKDFKAYTQSDLDYFKKKKGLNFLSSDNSLVRNSDFCDFITKKLDSPCEFEKDLYLS